MRRKQLLNLGPHGFHRLVYNEWGDAANGNVVICVHGLSRSSRDFDWLAQSLAARWRVVCPDMPGRGDSDWLPIKTDYGLPTYLAACTALIARLDVDQVAWLGTSMGGIIGMTLAAQPGTPIRRMVINDIGPFIPAQALQRIADYVGMQPRFSDLAEAETFLRQVMQPFGIHRQDHWRHLVLTGTRPAEGGGLRLHYDPGIAEAFVGSKIEDVSFWPVWDAIRCPVLALRGAQSDLLSSQVAKEMTERGPRCDLVEFPDCGHAPALMELDQIKVVDDWLAQGLASNGG